MNNLNLYSETVSGYTAVSDIFIDEYVPSANGDFVKVYLYLLRLFTRKNSNLSISSLADTFNQTENDVMRALRYWDRSGLVQLSYDDNNQLCGIFYPKYCHFTDASFRCKQKKQRSFAPGDGRSERCAYLIIFRLCGI